MSETEHENTADLISRVAKLEQWVRQFELFQTVDGDRLATMEDIKEIDKRIDNLEEKLNETQEDLEEKIAYVETIA